MTKKTKIELEKIQIETLTLEQKNMIQKLQNEFKNEFHQFPETNNSWYILRFLKARGMDFEQGRLMLKNFFEFRKTKKMEQIRKLVMVDRFQQDYYQRGYYHTTIEGYPVNYDRIGYCDLKSALKIMTLETLEDYFIQVYERLIYIILPICSAQHNRRIDKAVSILDLKNVKVTKVFDSQFKNFLKRVAKIGQDYYPELLHEMYIINAPMIFSGAWAVIRRMVDKDIQRKIHIYSNNAFNKLSTSIDMKHLPHFIGGDCKSEIHEEPGHWQEEVNQAIEQGRLTMSDNYLFNKYYLTQEEQKQIHQQSLQESKNNSLYQSTKSVVSYEKDLSTLEKRIKPVQQSTFLVKYPSQHFL